MFFLLIICSLLSFVDICTEDMLSKKDISDKNINIRTITINNKIDKKMRSYKKLFMSYEPSTFVIKANGKEIHQDGTSQVKIKNNRIKIYYEADFYGMQTARDYALFTIDPTTNAINISFDWKKTPRIVIDKALPKK